MTHVAKLLNCGDALAQFFDQITGLDEKLGPVLLQFAPGHTFEKGIVRDFSGRFGRSIAGPPLSSPAMQVGLLQRLTNRCGNSRLRGLRPIPQRDLLGQPNQAELRSFDTTACADLAGLLVGLRCCSDRKRGDTTPQA